jgi:choice-of-anchor C domain-containing protein
MHLDRLRAACAIALSASLVLVSSARADTLANGDFETGPAIPAQGILAVPPGNPALDGWTVVGGAINIVSNDYWASFSGTRSVALSSSGPGGILQSFASNAGSIYRLTFSMSGEPFSVPTVKNLRVQAGGTSQDFTFDVTPAWHWDMKWQQHTLDFVAPGPSTTVTLSSLDASAFGPAIDAVSVAFVSAGVTPTPLALALAPVAPDPVRELGRVAFTLPDPRPMRLSIVDLQGREVAVLARGSLGAGPHEVDLAARTTGLKAGLYFLVLDVGDRTIVRRFTLIR